MPLPPSEVTVAEILRGRGYQTAMFGKWHLGDLKPVRGGNRKWPVSHPGLHGFEEWLVTLGSGPTTGMNCDCFAETKDRCIRGHYHDHLIRCTNYYAMKEGSLEALDHPIRGDDSLFIVEHFERFLKKATKSDRPFFVYLPFHAVHTRYIATEDYQEIYTNTSKKLSQDEIDYYGSLSAMDDAVGRIRELLMEHKVSNNTMFWFTSDNGPAPETPGVTAGFRGLKGSLYEGGIRVPGLLEWPAMIRENCVTDFPVMSSDLLPTACDIANTTIPEDRPIDGVSILPLIKGETSIRNSSMKWAQHIDRGNFGGDYQAVISNHQYKLFVKYNKRRVSQSELYDLREDPFEEYNIKDKRRTVHDEMVGELEAWRLSVEHSAKNIVDCYNR